MTVLTHEYQQVLYLLFPCLTARYILFLEGFQYLQERFSLSSWTWVLEWGAGFQRFELRHDYHDINSSNLYNLGESTNLYLFI